MSPFSYAFVAVIALASPLAAAQNVTIMTMEFDRDARCFAGG